MATLAPAFSQPLPYHTANFQSSQARTIGCSAKACTGRLEWPRGSSLEEISQFVAEHKWRRLSNGSFLCSDPNHPGNEHLKERTKVA